MSNRIPPPLAPYIRVPPDGSVTLVTGVLGASANWVIVRYLVALLGDAGSPQTRPPRGVALDDYDGPRRGSAAAGVGDPSRNGRRAAAAATATATVVLVSFMRDYAFWHAEARRVGGLDLDSLHKQKRFVFVDGLSSLFSPLPTPTSAATAAGTATDARTPPGAVPTTTKLQPPGRNAPSAVPSRAPLNPPLNPRTASQTTTSQHPVVLTSSDLAQTEQTLHAQLASLAGPPVLILDTPSIFLQTTTSPPITSLSLTSAVLRLRGAARAVILSLPADAPFLEAAALAASGAEESGSRAGGGPPPLEAEVASFTVGMAHQASCVISCRELGTGWARDVSGVVRVTGGGGAWEGEDGEEEGGSGDDDGNDYDGRRAEGGRLVRRRGKAAGGEWLYHVAGDGAVKVWGRGEG